MLNVDLCFIEQISLNLCLHTSKSFYFVHNIQIWLYAKSPSF